MFWILTFLCILIPAIVIGWILKNPKEALWYKILRFIMGLFAAIGMTAGIFLIAGMIGLFHIETLSVSMVFILTGLPVADFFILLLSGKLMCPQLKLWKSFLGALGIQILSGAIMLMSLYL